MIKSSRRKTKNFDDNYHHMRESDQEKMLLMELCEMLENKLESHQKQKYESDKTKEFEQEKLILQGFDDYGLLSDLKKSEKRSRLELYHDILLTISKEMSRGEVKPTRIQFLANTAYDRLLKYLDFLESKGLIKRNPILLTDKGRQFLWNYSKIRLFDKN